MSLKIIQPGLLTTLQDSGRYGYQKIGVITSGAMDVYSLRLANILVGNDENEAALEITLMGPVIEFTEDALIAVTGGDFTPTINGETMPQLRPVAVRKGCVLQFNPCKSGCRAYLAVAGGYKAAKVMGSKSTYLRAQIGGFCGRALQAGDIVDTEPINGFGEKMLQNLLAAQDKPFAYTDWSIGKVHTSPENLYKPVRVMPGMQYDDFTQEAQRIFTNEDFLITMQSDRMGYRLAGSKLEAKKHLEMISEVASFGTIQVPPAGTPIILMADHQTVAGYPVFGQVAQVDVARVAQLKPEDKIHFRMITHEEGEQLFLEMEQYMENIKTAVKKLTK